MKTNRIPAVLFFLFVFHPAVTFSAGPGSFSIEEAQGKLKKAEGQLEIAIKQAELSVGPHQPGGGWTKKHMQRLLNVVEGATGADVPEKADNPGDGYGLLRYLKEAQQSLEGGTPEVKDSIEHALFYINEAVAHAKRSIKGKNAHEAHDQARLAAGLLVAARGNGQSDSPVTGGLDYALRRIEAGSAR
jgi:hypothetical protein